MQIVGIVHQRSVYLKEGCEFSGLNGMSRVSLWQTSISHEACRLTLINLNRPCASVARHVARQLSNNIHGLQKS